MENVTINITEDSTTVTINVTDVNILDEITFSPTPPVNPSVNKLWIQTS